MAWAVHVSATGFDIHTIGIILLVVGIIGAVLSMIFWSSWAGPGDFTKSPHLRRRGAAGLKAMQGETKWAGLPHNPPTSSLAFQRASGNRERDVLMLSAYLFDEQEGKKLETWVDAVDDVREGQLLWLDLAESIRG